MRTLAAPAAVALALVAGVLPVAGSRLPAPGFERSRIRAELFLPPPPATTQLVSATPSGGYAVNDARSTNPAVSADGRYVAFQSDQIELVAQADLNEGLSDVFLRDTVAGTTIRLGFPRRGTLPKGFEAVDPAISADGRIVAFTIRDPAGADSFVVAWNRATDTTTLVSRVGGTTVRANEPDVSADGRYVVYTARSDAGDLKDGNLVEDVYRADLVSGEVRIATREPNGGPPAGGRQGSISGDGRFVAFASVNGADFMGTTPGPGLQVFVADMEAETVRHVSGRSGGGAPNQPADLPVISADGAFVIFRTASSNVAVGDPNGRPDIYRHELATGTTVLASVVPEGGPAVGGSFDADLSSDGRIVAFAAAADTSEFSPSDVFARDLERGETILVSVAVSGGSGGRFSGGPAIGGAGRFVAFDSDVPGEGDRDLNQVADVFLRDLPPLPVLDPQFVDFGSVVIGSTSTPSAATLTNYGWSPLRVGGASLTGPDAARFAIVLDGCAARTLHRGDACTVTLTFAPTQQGARSATLRVTDDHTGSPRITALAGIGSRALVKLDPPVGPPGVVTVAEGEGFPPNVDLALSWSVGITPRTPPVRTDANGRFRVQVLVFHNDVVGERDLVITPLLTVGLSRLTARMTVVTPSMVPPGLLVVRIREGSRLRLFGRG